MPYMLMPHGHGEGDSIWDRGELRPGKRSRHSQVLKTNKKKIQKNAKNGASDDVMLGDPHATFGGHRHGNGS